MISPYLAWVTILLYQLHTKDRIAAEQEESHLTGQKHGKIQFLNARNYIK